MCIYMYLMYKLQISTVHTQSNQNMLLSVGTGILGTVLCLRGPRNTGLGQTELCRSLQWPVTLAATDLF